MAGAVVCHHLAHVVIEFLPMLGCTHIDKVDYDDSAHVAQTQLPRNLVGGAEIDIKSVLLLILHVAVAVARVHINHVKSFCVLNDDVCTRLERHRFSKRRLYLLRDVVEIEKGKDFVFTATVAVKPEVTLGDYKGIEVEKKTVKVMAADVNAEIDKVREQNSRMITVENRGIKKDDTAVIDFEGFVDGEPFQGGKGEDYSLVIGSHSFIDTFEDQLVGKKAGEEVDVNVTFPEEYHEASLKGKPALFKVTVKEIKKKELPKLDDEFASEVSEFETLKEYKASVKKNLTERRKEEAKREKENAVVEKVVENITVELPEPMIDEQTQQMIQEFAGRLSSQGLSFEQYMQMTGMTPDALMGQMKPEAEKRIRTRLALEAIVDVEKIKATAKDIDKEIENMANMYQMEVDKIKEMIGDAEKEQIGKDLAVQKAVDFVVKNAVEVEPAEEDKEEK